MNFYGKEQTQTQRDTRTDVFIRRLILAQHLNHRIIIHNLKTIAAIAAAIKTAGFTQSGIVHAFSGSIKETQTPVKLGFKIGINSLLLNPNVKRVRAALQALDDTDSVLEIDSPFMLGHKTNTPTSIRHIIEIVAELRGVPLAQLAEAAGQNVNSLPHTSPQYTDLKASKSLAWLFCLQTDTPYPPYPMFMNRERYKAIRKNVLGTECRSLRRLSFLTPHFLSD